MKPIASLSRLELKTADWETLSAFLQAHGFVVHRAEKLRDLRTSALGHFDATAKPAPPGPLKKETAKY